MFRLTSVAAVAALVALSTPASADTSCEITFRVNSTLDLFSLVANANYANAPGGFAGSSTLVECEALNGVVTSAGDAEHVQTLIMSAVAPASTSIKGPKDFLRCTFLATSGLPEIDDFDLSEQSGFTTGFQPADPQVTISDIDCGGAGTTTTTLPEEVCGDFNGNGVVQIADALGVLRSSVGNVSCPDCVCDVDGNGNTSITDALITLRAAVGLSPNMNCSAC